MRPLKPLYDQRQIKKQEEWQTIKDGFGWTVVIVLTIAFWGTVFYILKAIF